jgi:hypothetical protein
MTTDIFCADNLEWMRSQPGNVCDLCLFSPPYEAARTYGIGFNLRGEEYVAWLLERVIEALRITRGPVVCVVEGQTREFDYSAVPFLLLADLKRRGVTVRKPPIYRRNGIPGSGGPDWFRNDYEPCIVATNGGKMLWSDNTACGHIPKCAPGGEMSNRTNDGTRRNQWGGTEGSSVGTRNANGKRGKAGRPSHKFKKATSRGHDADGNLILGEYTQPNKANPGNVIQQTYSAQDVCDILSDLCPGPASDVIDCIVGGGVMGSRLCHENEAPFPESLAERFIRSFCPPNGTVLDICCGSGTTLAVAKRFGRNSIGLDVRESQVELSRRRVAEVIEPRDAIAAALTAL